jgi:DnaJ-class molecular chaperone
MTYDHWKTTDPADDTLGSERECERCNGSGLIGLRARTGTYVAPGPIPEDARGVFETICDVCRGSGVDVGGTKEP